MVQARKITFGLKGNKNLRDRLFSGALHGLELVYADDKVRECVDDNDDGDNCVIANAVGVSCLLCVDSFSKRRRRYLHAWTCVNIVYK